MQCFAIGYSQLAIILLMLVSAYLKQLGESYLKTKLKLLSHCLSMYLMHGDDKCVSITVM